MMINMLVFHLFSLWSAACACLEFGKPLVPALHAALLVPRVLCGFSLYRLQNGLDFATDLVPYASVLDRESLSNSAWGIKERSGFEPEYAVKGV